MLSLIGVGAMETSEHTFRVAVGMCLYNLSILSISSLVRVWCMTLVHMKTTAFYMARCPSALCDFTSLCLLFLFGGTAIHYTYMYMPEENH